MHARRPTDRISRIRADLSVLGFWGGFWTLVTVVAAAAFVFATFLLVKSEVLIDIGHGTTTARIVEVNHGGRGPGSLKIEFDVVGQTVTTYVEQPFFGGEDYQVGGQVQVEYANSDPGTARLAGQHILVGVIVLFALIAVAGWGWPRLLGFLRPGAPGRHGKR